MRLIFIRHGDPDYSIDNLTEKGKREVKLLTERICKWENITAFYPFTTIRDILQPKPMILKELSPSPVECLF